MRETRFGDVQEKEILVSTYKKKKRKDCKFYLSFCFCCFITPIYSGISHHSLHREKSFSALHIYLDSNSPFTHFGLHAMTLLYQPLSRTFGQRDGCITPNSHQEERNNSTLKSLVPKMGSFENSHDILSPPLSPYLKTTSPDIACIQSSSSGYSRKAYLQSNQPYQIEDFRSYTLTFNPWSRLGSDYKTRQMKLLSQYAAISSKEMSSVHAFRLAERRANHASAASRKRAQKSSSSDSETESFERIRTRKVVKEHLAPLSEIDVTSPAPSLPIPKKRKVRKEARQSGSPLAAQQAALIDESIPDYSPDANATLPKGNTRCLKIEWKGQPMDLKTDPNLDQLHPAEVTLASILRLPCNVYLDSKRRLFVEKVNRMKSGMLFRRTDAQKACRIDVNKASRLFAAFEKVGWLEDDHFVKYM